MQQSKSMSEIGVLFITQCIKKQPNNPKYSAVQPLFCVTMLYLFLLISRWQTWDLDADLWKSDSQTEHLAPCRSPEAVGCVGGHGVASGSDMWLR